ncbi:MAG: hypothetical protein GY705_20755 [Bacteroidetes bacterium]|nr:hypothetical protein [Bacteroidota bacterium]
MTHNYAFGILGCEKSKFLSLRKDIETDRTNLENQTTKITKEPNPIRFEKIIHFDNRFGNKKAQISGFLLTDDKDQKRDTFRIGMKIRLSLRIKCNEDVQMPLAGFLIKDLLGNELIKTNSDVTGNVLKPCKTGDTLQVTFEFSIPREHYQFVNGFQMHTINV